MSSYTPPTINHLALGELSRRKLHMVSMLPSDTLRRAVLIHNIVRSTASLPPSPTTPTILAHQSESQSDPSYDYYPPAPTHVSEGPEVESQAEMNFREAAATATDAGSDSDMFVFPPPMTTSAQEQIWLDSLLDDLEDDAVHVSVVEAEEHDGSEGEVDPLFATAATSCTSAPPPSLPHVSPPLRPALPYRHQQPTYSEPSSPPPSPPELDAHSFSDDDDDEDYMDDSDGDDEVVTPTSSTELRSSDSYFFSPLPFHCNFQPIN